MFFLGNTKASVHLQKKRKVQVRKTFFTDDQDETLSSFPPPQHQNAIQDIIKLNLLLHNSEVIGASGQVRVTLRSLQPR